MKIFRLTPGDLTRAVIAQMGANSEEIIEAMQTDGLSKQAAEMAFNRAMNGLSCVNIGDFTAVMKAMGVLSWGISKDGQIFAELPGRAPGGGRKRRTPDRIYVEVLERYAEDLRNGGKLLKRRELAKLCGVSVSRFNEWLAQQKQFQYKGEREGTRIWNTQ